MKEKLILLFLALIMCVAGVTTLFLHVERYSEMFEREVKLSADKIAIYMKMFEREMSYAKLVPFSSSLSAVNGYALMKNDGSVVYEFDIPSSFLGRYGEAYKYAMINGQYISPFFVSLNGKGAVLMAVKTIDHSHVALALVRPVRCNLANSYLVDGTALGLKLDGSGKWENFLALLSKHEKGVIWQGSEVDFIEPVNFGSYTLVMKYPFWSLIVASVNVSFYLWVAVFSSLLILFLFLKRSLKRKVDPLIELSNFIRKSKELRKFEGDNVEDETILKYNELVGDYEKLKDEHEDVTRELKEINSELTEMNKLFVEFSALFNEVRNGRKELDEALRVAFRRMLDFSRPITGIGMKYAKMEVYLGTVNEFNFENEIEGRVSLTLRTESKSVRYVVNTDRFTMKEGTREMVRTLLYHLTSFLSIYEMMEMNKSTMKYDPLTNLLTRQEFEEMVKREEALARRENLFLSFLVLDVKEMRKFNEKYGRLTGDALLKYVAKVIVKNVRFTDIAARYGEDEFIVCFHGMKKADCERKAEQIISQITQFRYEVKVKSAVLSYPTDGDNVSLLVSELEKKANLN